MGYTGHEHLALIADMDHDVVRRMKQWVQWRGYGGNQRSSAAFLIDYGTRLSGGYREAPIPVNVAEAELTDRVIKAAPDELGSAVALFWLGGDGGEDLSFVAIGAHLGCSHVTAKARIIRGHQWVTAEIYRLGALVLDQVPAREAKAGPRPKPEPGPVVLRKDNS